MSGGRESPWHSRGSSCPPPPLLRTPPPPPWAAGHRSWRGQSISCALCRDLGTAEPVSQTPSQCKTLAGQWWVLCVHVGERACRVLSVQCLIKKDLRNKDRAGWICRTLWSIIYVSTYLVIISNNQRVAWCASVIYFYRLIRWLSCSYKKLAGWLHSMIRQQSVHIDIP